MLTKNQLKILAMVCMTIDHIGAMLFPQAVWLRVIGRLAFPLFSYCIAEGCRYTRNKARYFGSVFACGAVCVIAFLPFGGFYGNALITLSLSILLLYGVEAWKSSGKLRFLVLTAALAAAFYLLCRTVYIDYGFAEAATTFGPCRSTPQRDVSSGSTCLSAFRRSSASGSALRSVCWRLPV